MFVERGARVTKPSEVRDLPVHVSNAFSPKSWQNTIPRPFTGRPAHPREVPLTIPMTRTEGMCITGRSGMAAVLSLSTGNNFFRYASEFGFQAFPFKKTLEQITDDPDDFNNFFLCDGKAPENYGANGKIMNYLQQTYRYPTEIYHPSLCLPASPGRCHPLWGGAFSQKQGKMYGSRVLAVK